MGGIELRFIGIDLAWRCGGYGRFRTAICECGADGHISSPVLAGDDEDILRRLPGPERCWIAIDAPLDVPNRSGSRAVEREVARSGVRILPSNREFLLRTFGGVRGEMLAYELERMGYRRITRDAVDPGTLVETYPYGILHGITRGMPPRYKHGPRSERAKGSLRVLDEMQSWEPGLSGLEWMRSRVMGAAAVEMDQVGDMIDAMLCATCLYAHWLYRGKRTRLFGDGSDGHILMV